jgi:hypothetical protein
VVLEPHRDLGGTIPVQVVAEAGVAVAVVEVAAQPAEGATEVAVAGREGAEAEDG